MAHLERALDQARLQIEHVRLIVCTHAHVDHCGQAPAIAERAGCEVWMHPNHAHHTPSATPRRRSRGASRSRAERRPEEPCSAGSSSGAAQGNGQAGTLRRSRARRGRHGGHRPRPLAGVETPGHAPSHVCLYQPERRLLISGDHLLGRVSLYFDAGYTPDPVGEFLGLARQGRGLARGSRCRATAGRSPTSPGTSPRTARWCAERLDAVGPRSPTPRDAVRDRPGRLRRALHRGHRQLAAEQDALLAHPPGARRPAAGSGESPERWCAA